METLLLKLVLTPALIAAASLAARRWGQAVGGWLVGLPLTSGPVAVFIALEHVIGCQDEPISGPDHAAGRLSPPSVYPDDRSAGPLNRLGQFL